MFLSYGKLFYNQNKHNLLFLFGFIYLVINRGMISSLVFSAHPTTWASLPAFIMCYFIHKKKISFAFISFLFMCICKEEFPFVGYMVASYFFYKKNYKYMVIFLLAALGFNIFEFFFRGMIFGPKSGHGERLIKTILTEPMTALSASFTFENIRRIFELFFPVCIVGVVLKRFDFKFLYFATPLLLIRALKGAWLHHYGAVIAVFILFSILFYQDRATQKKEESNKFYRPVLYFAIASVFIFNLGTLRKSIFELLDKFTTESLQRKASIEKSHIVLRKNLGEGDKILTMSNLVTGFVYLKPYSISQPRGINKFDIVWIEKKEPNHYGISNDAYNTFLHEKIYQNNSLKLLYEDDFILLGKGIIYY